MTDKTDRWEIQVAKNPNLRIEHHNHHNKDCDFDGQVIKFYSDITCGYKPAYGYYSTLGSKLYGRPGGWLDSYVQEDNGKARNTWRMQARDIIKMDKDDVEDVVPINPRHRHRALWEVL